MGTPNLMLHDLSMSIKTIFFSMFFVFLFFYMMHPHLHRHIRLQDDG